MTDNTQRITLTCMTDNTQITLTSMKMQGIGDTEDNTQTGDNTDNTTFPVIRPL